MKIDLSQFRQVFLQESADHVTQMESNMLSLQSAPDDVELLNSIFRSAHSIKGGAGSFGLKSLVRFTHSLENMLDQLRSLELKASAEVIDILLRSVDMLHDMLQTDVDQPMPAEASELVGRIEAILAGGAAPDAAAPAAAGSPNPEKNEEKNTVSYRVGLRPYREMFDSGTNPIVLLRNLADLGTVSRTEMNTADLPHLEDLDPALCYLSWTVDIETERPVEELREVFEFVEHLAEVTITPVSQVATLPAAASPAAASPAAVAPAAAGPAAPAASPAAAAAPPAPPAPPLPIPAQPDAKPAAAKAAPAKKPAASGEAASIRVGIDKIDRLIDLVGELVIAHVMTAQMVEEFEPSLLPRLRESVAAMERNTRELHERVMGVRMLPVGSIFQRYTRTVYDIAKSTGKKIRLDIKGEETEIDKSMLEMLGDPLTHLIRNSADHGVEMPEVRIAAGKPDEGVIQLRAFHRSGKVVIEITDDGAGIDPDRVRAKAIERGLISADAQLTTQQLQMLIFEPGFSTRDAISDLSGRGVGMDVVKRNIQQLSGTVAVSSVKGQGSTVTIELPLTLAIMEGLLVRVRDRTMVLPLLSVIETVPLQDSQIVRVAEQGEVVLIREESVPLLRMRRFLSLPQEGTDPAEKGVNVLEDAVGNRRLAVIVDVGNRKIGLVVDELLGQQQVVVKSLEKNLSKVEGLMGATILGDGCVAPIVDVAVIADMNLFSIQPGRPQMLQAPVALSR
jgi:two-component system chemotaxis sensor kinase CheA